MKKLLQKTNELTFQMKELTNFLIEIEIDDASLSISNVTIVDETSIESMNDDWINSSSFSKSFENSISLKSTSKKKKKLSKWEENIIALTINKLARNSYSKLISSRQKSTRKMKKNYRCVFVTLKRFSRDLFKFFCFFSICFFFVFSLFVIIMLIWAISSF